MDKATLSFLSLFLKKQKVKVDEGMVKHDILVPFGMKEEPEYIGKVGLL